MHFFDSHVHFFWRGNFSEAINRWQVLINRGLKGIAVFIVGHHPRSWERILTLVPAAYHENIDGYFLEDGSGSRVPNFHQLNGLEIFPYFDSRFMENQNRDLTLFRKAGFKGIKVLYVSNVRLGFCMH